MNHRHIPSLSLSLLLCGSAAHAAERLLGDASLRDDQSITSKNGRYRAVLQRSDGNFVVYDNSTGKAVWATDVNAGAGASVVMQLDGNLVVYDKSKSARWSSGTYEATAAKYFLQLDDDGQLSVQRGAPEASEGVLWSSRQGRRYRIVKDADIARTFRPLFKMSSGTRCFPLAFSEVLNTREQCNKSYDPQFAVFAHVTRAGAEQADTDGNTFRITYGVAFGYQNGTYTGATQDVISQFTDAGNHGDDAQYLVVDVVDGKVTSVWADMHAGYYARPGGALTFSGDRVVAWVGKYYHPLKLITERSSVCKSETEGGYGLSDNIGNDTLRFLCAGTCGSSRRCGSTDTVLNWGDLDGDDITGSGQLVMVKDACGAVNSYSSPDGQGYGRAAQSKFKLQGLWAYLGCNKESTEDSTEWEATLRGKPAYSNAYGLEGCKRGAAGAGSICHATYFPEGATWTTSRRVSQVNAELSIHPFVAGGTSVDYGSGDPFNDLPTINGMPDRITLRGGRRIDAVNTNYSGVHGGSGGSEVVFNSPARGGLKNDPVVRVELCSVTQNKKRRVGSIRLKTYYGATVQVGEGRDDCQTIAPYGKMLYGFYGRAGDEVDVLGTIWGSFPKGKGFSPKETGW